jgi:hypothetical protein
VVIAGGAEFFWSVVAAHSMWTLVSHTPLVLVLAFAVSGDHERVVVWFRMWWARVSPLIVRLVTSIVLLVGTLFLLDAAWWFVTGSLIPGLDRWKSSGRYTATIRTVASMLIRLRAPGV